jgi:hypothetical protein
MDQQNDSPDVKIPVIVGGILSVAGAVLSVLFIQDAELWIDICLISVTGLGVLVLVYGALTGISRSRVTARTGEADGRSNRLFLYAALGLGTITVFYVASIIVLQWAGQSGPELLLPMLLIGGVVALLLTLAIVAVVFSRYRLTDRSAALALPEGSVRAVIALSLILIFAIIALFLFNALNSTGTLEGLSQGEIDALPDEVRSQIIAITQREGTGETAQFDVQVRLLPSEVSQDFATQVLTTVSTLVVALSAFYFGAKTATPSTVEVPALRIVSPTSPHTPPNDDPIDIELDVRPVGSRVNADIVVGNGTLKTKRENDYTAWTFGPGRPLERTIIVFYLAEHPAALQRLVIQPPDMGSGEEPPAPPPPGPPEPSGEEPPAGEAAQRQPPSGVVGAKIPARDVPAHEVPVRDVPAHEVEGAEDDRSGDRPAR